MSNSFSRYQWFVVGLLAFLQFCVVVDFMILSPLGAILLHDLRINTEQFGLVVSAYAFSAGISGFLTAGFADRFDRKKLLLVFYAGFVAGTLFCGLAPDYHTLLVARIVTGLFGGVVGSIGFAILADVFPMQMRGRALGIVQTAFAASQVLGIPLGLILATHGGWHVPFLAIAAIAFLGGIVAMVRLKPLDSHLHSAHTTHPLRHLWRVASKPRHLMGFSATILLATGGYMLMPFGSAFSVQNLGIDLKSLPVVYVATGLASILAGPYLGRLADRVGKYPVFIVSTLATIGLVLFYTRLGVTPLWQVVLINIVLFVAINGRIVTASAIASGVPELRDRGAYMSINASIQQISGGVASWLAGKIVVQVSEHSPLQHYGDLGIVVTLAMLLTLPLMWNVAKMVERGASAASAPAA